MNGDVSGPVTPACVGCGAALGSSSKCDQCGFPAAGKDAWEEVPATRSGGFGTPDVCCCCLGPKEIVRHQSVMYWAGAGTGQMTDIPIPWCRSCRRRRLAAKFMAFVVFLVTVALTVVTGVVVHAQGVSGWITFGSCVVAFFLFLFLLGSFEKLGPFSRRGHTVGCRGFAGANAGTDGESFTLVFLNRKFAGIWRSMNAPFDPH